MHGIAGMPTLADFGGPTAFDLACLQKGGRGSGKRALAWQYHPEMLISGRFLTGRRGVCSANVMLCISRIICSDSEVMRGTFVGT